jgi:hypothetical protein
MEARLCIFECNMVQVTITHPDELETDQLVQLATAGEATSLLGNCLACWSTNRQMLRQPAFIDWMG